MREIGSEFWQRYTPVHREKSGHEAVLLSGRTALRFIIEDICRSRNVRKALLPGYCCDSMIIPFVQSGVAVEFYQVHRDGMDFPYVHDADIVFLIDFFGYGNNQNEEIARQEKTKGKIIIYDATHKLNGNKAVEAIADYTFCSYRKWFYCNYATAVKHHGTFSGMNTLVLHERYVKLRDDAACEKERYISGQTHEKDRFLADFGKAEQMLDEDYRGYAGVEVAADWEKIIRHRKENAAYLLNALSEISGVTLWRRELSEDDAPLFVPILVDPHIRADLRKYLISRQIYCPIHWPRSSYHGVENELYETELSLVCDQRYNLDDMKRMVCTIKEYFNR